MIVFICIWLIFAIFFLKNFHSTLMVYLPVSILLPSAFAIKLSPPAIAVTTALNAQILAMYFYKKKLNFKNFPLKKAFKFYIFVLCLAFLFTHVAYSRAFTNIVMMVLPILVSVVFYKELSVKKDFQLYHKVMLTVSIIFVTYGIVEFTMQFNPFLSFLTEYFEKTDTALIVFLSSEDSIRFGSIRCQSLFMHSISYGTYCVLFIIYFCFVVKECALSHKTKVFTAILIPLLLFCMVTSGSRSPMVGLMLGLLPLLSKQSLTKSSSLILFLIIIFIIFYQLDYIDIIRDLIISLFDTKGNTISGSSIDLRLLQLETCFQAISSNPFIGLGARGQEYAYSVLKLYNLAGLESIWFSTLVNYGLLGCWAFLYLYYSLYKFAVRNSGFFSFETSIVLCYFIVNTMTSIPGVDFSVLFFISTVMIMYKRERITNHCIK